MHFRLSATALILAASLAAQITSFPKPSYFRETFSRPITKVELQSPVRLADSVADGKLQLSLHSYLELVMANNTDIQIQRLSLEMPKNAILRAFGAFDPRVSASFNNQRSKTPSNDVLQGASTLMTLNQPASFSYQQLLPNGASYTASFSATKISTNSGFQNYNPALNSNLGINVSQPLLRGRGNYITHMAVMTARSSLRQSEYNLKANLQQLVYTAESTYWSAISARENLKVMKNALDLAEVSLKRSRRELELGAISPLDIYDPERTKAAAEVQVSQAQFALRQAEDALRRQIGADLDPNIRKLPIVLTETTEDVMPGATLPLDPEGEVEKALVARPELKSALQSLDIDELKIRSASNAMLPDLSLTGSYTAQGRGGMYYQRTDVFGGTGQIVQVLPGGFGDALNQMFSLGYPVWSVGLRLSLPIRNRAASADLADALVNKRRDALTVRSTEENIRLDVLNAVTQVESSKEQVRLSVIERDYAKKLLDAQQKKYDLGTIDMYFVLQAQNDLVNADSQVVSNAVGYRRNLLNLLRLNGKLLEERNIVTQ